MTKTNAHLDIVLRNYKCPSDKCVIGQGEGGHRLDLVLALDQQVQQLLGVHRCLAIVGHQPDQSLFSTNNIQHTC